MLALRFANGIFEPVWNRQFIDHAQITVAWSRSGSRTARATTRAPASSGTSSRTTCSNSSRWTAMEPPIDPAPRRCATRRSVLRPAHAGTEAHRPRPVRARLDRRREVPAYRGGGRRARFDHRHVHRRQALRGQLALGGHAVLRARGEAARATGDDDRDPVPARAAPPFEAIAGGGPAAERPRRPCAAGRGRPAFDRREVSARE